MVKAVSCFTRVIWSKLCHNLPFWKEEWGCKPLTFETKATTALCSIYPLRKQELTNQGHSIVPYHQPSLVICFGQKLQKTACRGNLVASKLSEFVILCISFFFCFNPFFPISSPCSVLAPLLCELMFCVGWKIRKLLENWPKSQCSRSNCHWQRQIKYFAQPHLFREE